MRALPVFDCDALYEALDALAAELGCTPARLTNLRTARLADMDLALRVTQWLGRPAAAFIHPSRW